MIVYVNSNDEIKDVGVTLDSTLIPLEIDDSANPFLGWSTAKICCFKVNVSDGRVTMMTPYVDSRLIEHIDRLSVQTESVVTDMKLDAVLLQAKMNAETNTDEQAYRVKSLYDNWEDKAEGTELTVGTFLNYEEVLYKVLQKHNKQEIWTPKDAPSLFAKVLIPDPEYIPEWEQPSSTNPYMKGDKVRHIGYIWESLVDNNVWEPSDAVPTLWENKGAE